MITEKLIDNAQNLVQSQYEEVSVTTIQRRFTLGYVAASQVIEVLRQRGVLVPIEKSPRLKVVRPTN